MVSHNNFNTSHNYKRDVLVNTIAQLCYLFALWLMTILTPRLSNSADAGVFTICLSVSNICTAIATYSINFYIASDIKNKFSDQHYVYFGFTSTFISFLVSLIISLSFGYFYDSVLFWAVILYYIFKCAENMTVIITASMQRAGKLYISGYALIVKAIIALGIFSLSLFLSKNIALTFGLLAIFGILYFVFVDFVLLKKYTNTTCNVTKEIYKSALKLFILAFPVFLYGVSFATIVSFPRMVLNQFVTKEIVGYFGSMAAVSTLIQSALSAMLIPFLPKFADLFFKNKKNKLCKYIIVFIAFVVVATGLAFLCACFLDKWLVGIIYPFDFNALKYAYYFKWIILATGIQAFTILSSLLLISFRKLFALTVSSLVGLLITFVASYLLIPTFYIDGVVYTYMLGYGASFMIGAIFVAYFVKQHKKNPMIANTTINSQKDRKAEQMCGLKQFHEDCIDILKLINLITRKEKIIYSTFDGTMLGQIRHKGFIPWDDDVDIIMTRDNFNKFISAWNDKRYTNYKLLTPNSYNGSFVDVVYRIINLKSTYKNAGNFNLHKELAHPWIDIFVLDNAPNNKLIFKLHTFRLKIIYAMLSSKKKIKIKIKRPCIEKIGFFIFKTIGYAFNLNFLLKRYNELSQKFNVKTKKPKSYYVSNSLLDIHHKYQYNMVCKTVNLPFCSISLKCYVGYKDILKFTYGNFMTPIFDPNSFIRHFELSSTTPQELHNFYFHK